MFNRTLIATVILGSSFLTACGSDGSSDDDSMSESSSVFSSFPAEGSFLPYSILRADLIDAVSQQPFEIRNGGFGSAMTGHPSEPGQFYALTDRGPNATYSGGSLGSGKIFPTPDYTPRIGRFEVQADGAIVLLETILLKRPDGSLITGLPNTSALGGTGETPYNADGNPVVVDQSQPYDETTNPLRLDDYGLDGEGLAALADGSFWVSDEYGPHMVHFDAEGKEIDRINPFAADTRVSHNLPAEFANRRANRGMEGLAVTPDGKILVGIMQSTMGHPDSSVQNQTITRIVTIKPETGEVAQYLYKQEKNANSNSELLALSATEFLVLERDGSFLYGGPGGASAVNPAAQKQVYRIDLSTGTNLEAVAGSGDLAQDPDLGLTISGQTLEQAVLAGGWDSLSAPGHSPGQQNPGGGYGGGGELPPRQDGRPVEN